MRNETSCVMRCVMREQRDAVVPLPAQSVAPAKLSVAALGTGAFRLKKELKRAKFPAIKGRATI
jgi:hypothetical protein